MYNPIREFAEKTLRIPPDPGPPPGDESKTRVFRAAPNYYKYLLAVWALKTAAALLAVLLFELGPLIGSIVSARKGRDAGWTYFVIAVLILVFMAIAVSRFLALFIVRLDFDKRWYVVTDRSLRVREGIFIVREATVTFANIQNISISQGPLQRALGIADLRVDTAGGGATMQGKNQIHNMHTTWFRGVNNAAEIRELMQLRLRQLKDAGLGDHDDHHSESSAVSSASTLEVLREIRREAAELRAAV